MPDMAPDNLQRPGDPPLRHFVTQEEVQAWLDDLDSRKPGLGRIVLSRALQNGVFIGNGEYLAREWLDSHPARAERRVLHDRRARRRRTLRFWRGARARHVPGRRRSDKLGFIPSRGATLTAIGTAIIAILLFSPSFQARKQPPPFDVRQHPMEPRKPQ